MDRPAEESAEQTETRLERISVLTQTARTTWFGYLGALAFAGVTLLGVEDRDFFSANADTQLPLVNVSVPVTSFFWVGAPLVALIYGYLHVFLAKLWAELGAAKPVHGDRRLATLIRPWLVSDFALRWRDWLRGEIGDGSIEPNLLGGMGTTATFLMCWLGGPVVLFGFWYTSMPAHDALLTSWQGMLLALALWTCLASFLDLTRSVRAPGRAGIPLHPAVHVMIVVALVAALTPISRARTVHDLWAMPPPIAKPPDETDDQRAEREARQARITHLLDRNEANSRLTRVQNWFRPVRARLSGVRLTQLPADWVTYDIARKAFFADWCARPDTPACPGSKNRAMQADDLMQSEAFVDEWAGRRAAYLRVLEKPILKERDLARADLTFAFLPGIDLWQARLPEANLFRAQLEGADLRWAELARANFRGALMQGTDLFGANLPAADLTGAQLQRADLGAALIPGAVARGAQMESANLVNAQLQRANLSSAQLQRASLAGAQAQGARFVAAQMLGTDLSAAKMQGADLQLARLQKAQLRDAQLQAADLRYAHLIDVDLREAQLQGANLRYAIVAGTTEGQVSMGSTNLGEAVFHGGALRFVDLRPAITDPRTDFRNSFGDNTVRPPPDFERPCQWADDSEDLTEEAFFARWRGWVEHRSNPDSPRIAYWPNIAPEQWHDVSPVPPPPGCVWDTRPLPEVR